MIKSDERVKSALSTQRRKPSGKEINKKHVHKIIAASLTMARNSSDTVAALTNGCVGQPHRRELTVQQQELVLW